MDQIKVYISSHIRVFVLVLIVLSVFISGCSFFCYFQDKKQGVGKNAERENIRVFSFRLEDFSSNEEEVDTKDKNEDINEVSSIVAP